VKEERIFKNGEKKEVTLTAKQDESALASDLIYKFHDQMWMIYRRNSYNICNQFKYYRSIKEKLTGIECFIHVDFAENYVGKMGSEIQSMHFGASQSQTTLHTGYYKVGGKESIVSFSGVSVSLQHDPAAVWAFMSPIQKEIKGKYTSVEYAYVYSDGPTTQYRQKANVMVCLLLYKMFCSFVTYSHGNIQEGCPCCYFTIHAVTIFYFFVLFYFQKQ
jgi:hypothetical protein